MKKLFQKYFPSFYKPQQLDCIAIAKRSGAIDEKSRVADFNLAAPDCVCELQTTSNYSRKPVHATELLTRFAFHPIHFEKRNHKLKNSIFSQVANSGCSIQRENLATNNELRSWLTNKFANDGLEWQGIVQAKCDDVRQIMAENSKKRALAVYDTAEKENPSHAEIFQTQYVIDDADRLEIRRKLFKAFGDGQFIQPSDYRENALKISA